MPITVELFTAADCPGCARAVRVLQRICKSLDYHLLDCRVVDVLDEIDYAVALGVLSTPALAIDGKLVFTSFPPEKRLRKELMERTSCDLKCAAQHVESKSNPK